jgi:hypothetical protein
LEPATVLGVQTGEDAKAKETLKLVTLEQAFSLHIAQSLTELLWQFVFSSFFFSHFSFIIHMCIQGLVHFSPLPPPPPLPPIPPPPAPPLKTQQKLFCPYL